MPKDLDKDGLAEWIIEKSVQLQGYWQNVMEAEQAGFRPNGSHLQSDRIQSIATQARNNVKKFRTELAGLEVSYDLDGVKVKCGTYLDNWDIFFYNMAKYDVSGNIDDFGVATRAYKAVDVSLSEILEMLGVGPAKRVEGSMYLQSQQPRAISPRQVREREIIREKEVIVKAKCSYCHRWYNETLGECPHCGAKR